jgi:hypothetical protein
MKLDWFKVVRDVLMVLVLLFVLVAGAARAMDGLPLNLAFGASFIAMTLGFALSGCLSPSSRLSHLLVVALGVWVIGTLLNLVTRGFPIEAVWRLGLQSSLPVAGSVLLGGALSLIVVKTPEGGAAVGGSQGDSSSPQA